MIDVLDYAHATTTDPHANFVVSSGDLYPKMIENICELNELTPAEARQKMLAAYPGVSETPILSSYMPLARRLPKEAWELALKAPEPLNAEELAIRKEALECARHWFTWLLRLANKREPTRLRITQVPGNIYRWKLHATIKEPLET